MSYIETLASIYNTDENIQEFTGTTFPLFNIFSPWTNGTCTKDNLVGTDGSKFESIAGIYTNVDSLKNLIAGSAKSIGTLNFNKGDSYTYVFLDDRAGKSKRYSFDSTKCEIILGAKEKKRGRSNLEIIYLDSEFLIFKEDNNPKGYVTHLLVRM